MRDHAEVAALLVQSALGDPQIYRDEIKRTAARCVERWMTGLEERVRAYADEHPATGVLSAEQENQYAPERCRLQPPPEAVLSALAGTLLPDLDAGRTAAAAWLSHS